MTYYWILAIVLLLLTVGCVLTYRIYRKLRGQLPKLRRLKNQLDEIYILTSRNNALLERTSETAIPKYRFDDRWCENHPAVCHALGEIDGVLFSECKEAFEKNYQAGFRVFELDFCLTKDGIPAILHDWDSFDCGAIRWSNRSEKSDPQRVLTNEAFAEAKILGKYTSLTLERFVKLAKQYADARFILSVKTHNQNYDDDARAIFRTLFAQTDRIDPEIRNRYILHAYSFDFLKKAVTEFSFSSAIYRCTTYPHPSVLADTLNQHGIRIITALNDIYARRDYLKIFHENGIKVIGCVTDANPDRNRQRVACWKRAGADMIMTPYGGSIYEEV